LENEESIAKLRLVGISEDSEPGVDQGIMVMNALELVVLVVELWKSVPWAEHNS